MGCAHDNINPPRAGSDPYPQHTANHAGGFNPRSRTGSDETIKARGKITIASIHAPARGATLRVGLVAFLHACFNPRSRTGSDARRQRTTPRKARFQSTLPHGERPATCANTSFPLLLQSTLPHGERPQRTNTATPMNGFNPRSRTGSDPRPALLV